MIKAAGAIGVSFAVLITAGNAFASFDRELENLNRKRSMRLLDEFNENIASQVGTVELTPDQIRRSLNAQQEMDAERAAFDKKSSSMGKELDSADKKKLIQAEAQGPIIPKEQLREMLGLEMESANEQVPLAIKTDISMKTVRESNYFGHRIDAVGETQSSYYPGVHATTRQLGWAYKSDYKMGRFLHMNTPHNDRVDHTWSQTLTKTQSKTTWSFASDLAASSIQSEEAVIKPSRYMTSDFQAGVDYALSPKTTLGLDYTRDTMTYLSDTSNASDVRNHTFGTYYQYALTAKTSLKGGVSFRMNRPPKGPKADNLNVYNYYVNLNGRFTDKVFYSIRSSLDFSKRSIETSPMQDFVSLTAAVTYVYSTKTRLTLNASRSRVPTLTETGSDPENFLGSFRISHDISSKISISATESIRIITGNGDFPSQVVDPDYPLDTFTANERDIHWGTGVQANYRINSSSSLLLRYEYVDVNSKLKTNSRINHICEVAYAKKF